MYRRAVLVVATTVALTSCTPLITSSRDYQTAGARSAGDASSQVASAALAAQLAMDGRAFGPYLTTVVSDAEGSLSGIESTFSDLQPPTPGDEVTRSQVLDVLNDAVDQVAGVRVAIVAGREPTTAQLEGLTQLRDDLDQLAGELA